MKNDFWSDQPKNISAQDTSTQSKTLRTKLCQNGEKWGEKTMNDELVLCRQDPEKSTLSHVTETLTQKKQATENYNRTTALERFVMNYLGA